MAHACNPSNYGMEMKISQFIVILGTSQPKAGLRCMRPCFKKQLYRKSQMA